MPLAHRWLLILTRMIKWISLRRAKARLDALIGEQMRTVRQSRGPSPQVRDFRNEKPATTKDLLITFVCCL